MPWTDWQFYAVTAAALWGLWTLVRTFGPKPRGESACPSCPSCAAGSAANRRVAGSITGSSLGQPLVQLGGKGGAGSRRR